MNFNLSESSRIIDVYTNISKFNIKNFNIINELEHYHYPFKNFVEKGLLNLVLEHLFQSFDII